MFWSEEAENTASNLLSFSSEIEGKWIYISGKAFLESIQQLLCGPELYDVEDIRVWLRLRKNLLCSHQSGICLSFPDWSFV